MRLNTDEIEKQQQQDLASTAAAAAAALAAAEGLQQQQEQQQQQYDKHLSQQLEGRVEYLPVEWHSKFRER